MSRTKEGTYTVEDVIRFRSRPDGVEKRILETAQQDGVDVIVALPVDPGAAGKTVAQMLVRKLSEQGNIARLMNTRANKVTRFSPFSAICEAGGVQYVRGPWNEVFLLELEAFTGEKGDRDDIVDSCSDAFMVLANTKFLPSFTLEAFTKPNEFKRTDLI